MTTLFPRNTEASHDIFPSNVVLPPVVGNEGKNTIAESSEMVSKTISTSSENENGNLQMNGELISAIIKAFKSFTKGNCEDLKSLHLRNKVEVEEHINLIVSAIPRLAEQRSRSSEDKEFPCDDSHLVEDLSTLFSLLRGSEYDSKAMIELLKSMETRLPQLEALLSFFVPVSEEMDKDHISDCFNLEEEDNKTKDSAAAGMFEDEDSKTKDPAVVEMVEDEDSKANDSADVEMVEDEDAETKDSAAAELEEPSPKNKGAGGSQGNGKNKKKNKPKKGKRSKRR